LPDDPVLFHRRSTYPGSRLPHVWLSKKLHPALISTIDIVGKGRFTLLTGIGGAAWLAAARSASAALDVPIEAYSIGVRQDYEDAYFDWARVRGVEDSGCVLVRPDRFVAWRCREVAPDAEVRLAGVMKSILAVGP
jgi:hypothetical protein